MFTWRKTIKACAADLSTVTCSTLHLLYCTVCDCAGSSEQQRETPQPSSHKSFQTVLSSFSLTSLKAANILKPAVGFLVTH